MTHKIEEMRRDRITEDATNFNTTREFLLTSEDEIDLDAAYGYFIQELNSNAIMKRQLSDGRKIIRFEIEGNEDAVGKYWTARVEWGGPSGSAREEYPEEPPPYYPKTITTEGGTARITQAYDETYYSCPNYEATTNFCGIGWNGEQNEGCDIIVPCLSFTLEKEFLYEDVTVAQEIRWSEITGCVNHAAFHDYPPGTVLFTGVSGSTFTAYGDELIDIEGEDDDGNPIVTTYKKAITKFKMTFKFRCSPNETFDVAGVRITKGGWQYYWVLKEATDTEDGKTRKDNVGVYVNTVYRTADFGDLGL